MEEVSFLEKLGSSIKGMCAGSCFLRSALADDILGMRLTPAAPILNMRIPQNRNGPALSVPGALGMERVPVCGTGMTSHSLCRPCPPLVMSSRASTYHAPRANGLHRSGAAHVWFAQPAAPMHWRIQLRMCAASRLVRLKSWLV